MENTVNFLADDNAKKFTVPKLPYAYNALEPYIDTKTMQIHHDKHHQAYVDKLNAAVNPSNMNFDLDDDMKCRTVNMGTDMVIRNNLGGHYNHSLFWSTLKPNPKGAPNDPSGLLMEAINKNFKSYETFKNNFSDRAAKFFGSGWCWLVVLEGSTLNIVTTANQDNPLMELGTAPAKPILGIDLWEHAYYLKHQNKRADYIAAWWNVVNWKKVEELFSKGFHR
ncbi:MAG: superoxide dismutase [Bacteroidia bacterium]|nr:superoxide dismutase [Bacteroidia bacterium]